MSADSRKIYDMAPKIWLIRPIPGGATVGPDAEFRPEPTVFLRPQTMGVVIHRVEELRIECAGSVRAAMWRGSLNLGGAPNPTIRIGMLM